MPDQQIGDLTSTIISAFAYKASNAIGVGNRTALFNEDGILYAGVGAGNDLDSVLATGNTSDDSIILTGARTTAPAQTWHSLTVTPYARNNVMVLENAYYNGGFKYQGDGLVTGFYLTAGKTQFISAPSGTTGGSVSMVTNAEFMNNGLFVNYKGQSFASSSGTNRDVVLFNPNSGADNLGYLTIQPTNATNASSQFHMIPKGTGYGSTFKSGISLWNTDFTADATNYEVFQMNASGSSGFIINSAAGGTGTVRPMHFQVSNTDALQIAGDRSISFNSAYTFPLAAGSANQVLSMPASGTGLVWATPSGGGGSEWSLSGTDLYPTTATEIGIGTSSPSFPLHVYKNANSGNYIKVENPNAGSGAAAGMIYASDVVSASISANSSTAGAYGVLTAGVFGIYSANKVAIAVDANLPFVVGTGSGVVQRFAIGGTGVVTINGLGGSGSGYVAVDNSGNLSWSAGTGGGGSSSWGSITGTLSSQSDLNTALAGKAPTSNPTFTTAITTPRIISSAGTPTAVDGPNLNATVTVDGTDIAGRITVVVISATSTPTLEEYATVTFAVPYASQPRIVFSPGNAAAANLDVYLKNPTTNNFSIAKVSSGTSSVTTYIWDYIVIQ